MYAVPDIRMQSEVLHNVNFLRFIFAVLIVYFHITHSVVLPFVPADSIMLKIQNMTHYLNGIVECFFMISGFFFFRKYEKGFTRPVHSFIFDKYMRLAPVMFAAMVLSFSYAKELVLVHLAMLNCMGMGIEDGSANWYVSAFFYGIIFYYALYRFISREKAFFITCILTCWGFAIILTSGQGKLHYGTLPNGLNLGLLRSIAGIGTGIILARLLVYLQPLLENIFTNHKFRTVFFTLAETIALGMLLKRGLLGEKFQSQIIVVLLFAIILSCFSLNYGLLARLLNHSFSSFLGKYSYSIYVMQQVTFSIFCSIIWPRYPVMVNNLFLCISSVLLLNLFLGIAGYHFVEQPAISWYKKHALKS